MSGVVKLISIHAVALAAECVAKIEHLAMKSKEQHRETPAAILSAYSCFSTENS